MHAGDIGNQDAVDSVVSKADVVIETLGAQLNRPTRVKQVCKAHCACNVTHSTRCQSLAPQLAVLAPGWRKRHHRGNEEAPQDALCGCDIGCVRQGPFLPTILVRLPQPYK